MGEGDKESTGRALGQSPQEARHELFVANVEAALACLRTHAVDECARLVAEAARILEEVKLELKTAKIEQHVMDHLCIALKAQESQTQAQCMIEYVQQMLLKVSDRG